MYIHIYTYIYIAALVFDAKLWIVGGYRAAQPAEAVTDVWYSADGHDWHLATNFANWGPRFGAQPLVFQNRMWLLGGSSSSCDASGATLTCEDACGVCACDGQSSAARSDKSECKGGAVWMDSYSLLRLNHLHVTTTTTVFGADNEVQLAFTLDRFVPSGSTLRIQLDADVLTVPGEQTTVLGRSRDLFENIAKWDAALSSLVVTCRERCVALRCTVLQCLSQTPLC